MRFHLARMLAVEPGTRSGEDPEHLHKMRVATRRQRAAWRVFGDTYDAKRTKRHRDRLRDVARRLGTVRDLDVLIENAVAYQKLQSEAELAAFEPLVASWRVRRDDARVLLVRELDSRRYLEWLDDYVDFVQTEGRGALTVTATVAHRVRDTMPSRIWAAYEGVRAYEPVLRWADVPTLHDLRIAGKWLRYTIEFVREALGPDATPLIEKVVALQDHLGLLNDADVAGSLARQFLVEHAGDLDDAESAAIGRYLVDRERELARLRRAVGPTWRGVAGLIYRRQLGRLVAVALAPRGGLASVQPCASDARRSRHAAPPRSTAKTVPSRMPRIRHAEAVEPVPVEEREHDRGATGEDPGAAGSDEDAPRAPRPGRGDRRQGLVELRRVHRAPRASPERLQEIRCCAADSDQLAWRRIGCRDDRPACRCLERGELVRGRRVVLGSSIRRDAPPRAGGPSAGPALTARRRRPPSCRRRCRPRPGPTRPAPHPWRPAGSGCPPHRGSRHGPARSTDRRR